MPSSRICLSQRPPSLHAFLPFARSARQHWPAGVGRAAAERTGPGRAEWNAGRGGALSAGRYGSIAVSPSALLRCTYTAAAVVSIASSGQQPATLFSRPLVVQQPLRSCGASAEIYAPIHGPRAQEPYVPHDRRRTVAPTPHGWGRRANHITTSWSRTGLAAGDNAAAVSVSVSVSSVSASSSSSSSASSFARFQCRLLRCGSCARVSPSDGWTSTTLSGLLGVWLCLLHWRWSSRDGRGQLTGE